MKFNGKLGVIDTQDALIGNRAYDLASLIDDVRYKTPNSLKDKVYKYYLNTNKQIDTDKFKNDFDILSVLRNLKIIGIFMRLAERDKKRKYLISWIFCLCCFSFQAFCPQQSLGILF